MIFVGVWTLVTIAIIVIWKPRRFVRYKEEERRQVSLFI